VNRRSGLLATFVPEEQWEIVPFRKVCIRSQINVQAYLDHERSQECHQDDERQALGVQPQQFLLERQVVVPRDKTMDVREVANVAHGSHAVTRQGLARLSSKQGTRQKHCGSKLALHASITLPRN
jgi:hypothetical protein